MINRRSFLSAAGAAAASLALARPRARAARKPNIVLMMADDLGYNELGCYGQKYIRTPNIDRIRREGIKFTQHYSGTAVCAPARCMLMTGKHSGHAYIRDNGNPAERRGKNDDPLFFPGQHPIPDSEVTIAEQLKAAGYATGAMGKWGLGFEGSSGDPNKQGFDLFYGYLCQVHAHNHYPRFLWKNGEKIMLPGNDRTLYGEQYSQDLFMEEAVGFMKKNKDQPFFLYLPFIIPHLSIQAPEESVAEYRGVIPEEDYVHKGYLPHPTPRAGYAAMVTHMDKGVGIVLDTLEELGLEEDTLVIFTSDNGPTYDRLGGSDSDFFESAGDFRGLKGSLYEGGIRVPLVARWPGRIKPGGETEHLSAFWDYFPTLCDAAETDIPDGLDGISFLPTLTGEGEQRAHEYLYWEFPAYGGQQALRMGPWKAVRPNIKKGNRAIELYNLDRDIGETKDLAKDYPSLVGQISAIMASARTPSKMFPLFPEDKE